MFFNSFIRVMSIFRNNHTITSLILFFFQDFARCQLDFLPEEHKVTFFNETNNLFKCFTECGYGKKERSVEGDQHEKLLILLSIVDILGEQSHFRASEVSFYGLSIVIPLINRHILQLPQLCGKYYSIVYTLCRLHTDKISRLPPPVFIALINTIKISLRYFDNTNDILKNTLQSINLIIGFYFDMVYQKDITIFGENQYSMISSFLEYILQLLFVQDFQFKLFDLYSRTLYSLICFNQDLYINMCHELVFQQEENIKQIIQDAVEQLNRVIPQPAIYSQNVQEIFSEKLKLFLLRTRAVVRLKS